MSKHTPIPWAIKAAVNGIDHDFGIFREGHAGVLAECFEEFEARGLRQPEIALANAEFIVRACNSHEDLLKAAKGAIQVLEEVGEDYYRVNSDIDALEAAIKKAEGR
jgi:hypothetical protein